MPRPNAYPAQAVQAPEGAPAISNNLSEFAAPEKAAAARGHLDVPSNPELLGIINPRINAKGGRQAMRFDTGANNRMVMDFGADFALKDGASLSWWQKTPKIAEGNSAGGGTYIGFYGANVGGSSSVDRLALASNTESFDRLRLYATQPDGTHLSASAGTTVIEGLDGGWHNYALVVTSNNIKLYRNAQEIFSVSGAIELIGRYLYIAGNPASQANRQFNISDIVAYNYAIPATTTNGIPGVIERYNSGEFLTAGDLANPVDDAVGSDSALSYGSTDSDVTSNVDYLPGVSSVTANSGSRIGGEGDWFLRATSTGTSLCRVGISDLFQVKEGEVIRYNFWLRSNSNHTPREIRLGGINGLALAGSSVIAGTFTFDEWVNFSGYYTPTSDITGLYIRIDNVPGDATFDIDDWSVDVLAATLALISESIQPERGQWLDVSANRLPALQAATGTSVINPRSGQKTFAQRTATNGSVWAGGADRMILPDHHTLDAIYVRSAAGGETVQVGSTAGGANIVASVTLVAGLNRLVMVAAASSTAKVSLTSDSTNALEWDIRYTKAAFFA